VFVTLHSYVSLHFLNQVLKEASPALQRSSSDSTFAFA